MEEQFSPEYPLGFTFNRFDHRIEGYLSWDEVYHFVKNGGGFIGPDGYKYTFPYDNSKDRLPLVTYKGNFNKYQSNASFTGERTPFIFLDIDLDEKLSGFNKNEATAEQRDACSADFDKILYHLSSGSMKFFFIKRSHSGCGRHLVIKLEGADPSKMALCDAAIMDSAQEQIYLIQGLRYSYKVDRAMKTLNQGFFLNHDPSVMFNPDNVTPASSISLPSYHADYSHTTHEPPGRVPNEFDRKIFSRFSTFCETKKIRLPHTDIFALGLIWFCFHPSGSRQDFIDVMTGFNAERSKQRGNSAKFLSALYDSIRRSNSTYKGKRVTVDSLYHFLAEYKFGGADVLIHFSGYLDTIKKQLFAAFDSHSFILLKAPTGAGKTWLLFQYIKSLARKNPNMQYVFALPYISMVEQFAYQNSDDEFEIRVLHGGVKNQFPGFIKNEIINPKNTPTKVLPNEESVTVTVMKEEVSFIKCVEREYERTGNWSKNKAKNKKKKKNETQKTTYVKLLDDDKQKLSNIWVTTFDSAKLIKHVDVVVIDECHDLIKQYGFRPIAVNALDGIIVNKTIMTSATPDALIPEVLGAHYIECIKDDKPQLKLNVVQVNGSAVLFLKDKIRFSKSSLNFINDRTLCKQIKEDLSGEGITISLYNSEEKKSESFKVLNEKQLVGQHAVATSIIGEGINVLNGDIEVINIVNETDIDNIIQAAARPRECLPQVNLILSITVFSTKYPPTPKIKIYQLKMAHYSRITDRLNLIVGDGKAIDHDGDTYAALDGDYPFIYLDKNSRTWRVDEFKVKHSVNESYTDNLYRFCYDAWLKELRKHFEITEIVVENDEEDPDTGLDFELFKSAGDDVIMAFYQWDVLKKNNRFLKMPSELMKWATDHTNIQWHRDFRVWTGRYVAMKEAGSIDWKVIESSGAFAYWERKYKFTRSVIGDGLSAKDVLIEGRSHEIVDFIVAQDTSQHDLTSTSLLDKLNEHLKVLGHKTENSQKPFYNKISGVVEIKYKQHRDGKRYIAQIIDKRPELMPKNDDIKDFDL